MGFIPINVNDAKEPKPVPVSKYDLTILNCEPALSRNKKPQLIATIGIDGYDEAPPVMHYISLPAEGDEPDKMKYKVLMLKRFITLFGVSVANDGFDPEKLGMELAGKRARAELTLETEKDGDGNEKADARTFNRLQVPRLKDEGTSGQAAKGTGKPPKS
jgi:hypothetical protein